MWYKKKNIFQKLCKSKTVSLIANGWKYWKLHGSDFAVSRDDPALHKAFFYSLKC